MSKSLAHGWFITGTDTGVGKTYVSVQIVRALRAAGRDAVGFKPICCGGREDAEALAEASGLATNDVNPVWLRPPLAPFAAAMVEGRQVDLDLIRDRYATLRAAHELVVVEGAGGWLVPVTREWFLSDYAAELALPVIVVSANKLGTLNHTLLTVRAVAASGLACAGVVLNDVKAMTDEDPSPITNAGVLEELLGAEGVPFVGAIENGATELPRALKGALGL